MKVVRPRGVYQPPDSNRLVCPTPQTADVENKQLFCQLSNPKKGSADRVENAARWFARNRRDRTRAFVPLLRDKFGLTPMEAIKAAQLAREIEFGEAR